MNKILLSEAFVDIKGNMAPYRQSVVKTRTHFEAQIGRMNKAVQKHQAAIRGIGIAMTAAGVAITAGFVKAIQTTGDFQQSMANTQSVAGATSDELQQLTDHARKMGEKSVFSAKQAADAMYSLASAGFDTEKIMKSLEGTLALAAATQSDLAFTTQVVASTLSAFGLEASEADRIANTFAATISASQATMDKLATSMSFVGPVARSVGMSLEETTGILGSLFNAGIDASTAGTSLRQAIAKLLKPTDDAQKALDRLGVSVRDSSGGLRSFTDIVADLEAASLTAEDALTIFGIRAGPGMLALVNQGSDSLDTLIKKVTDTQKATEMAELQTKTFQGQMKMLKSAVEELQIAIGTTLLPALTDLIKKMTDAVKVVSEWTREHPKLTEALAKFGLVIGGLMAVGGPLLLFAPTILKGVVAVKALGVALVGLPALGPIAIGLAAIATGIGLITIPTREFNKARERGRMDVTGEFERNRQNIEQIRKGIEIETNRIQKMQEDISTFGPHPVFLKTIELAQKRLERYRRELFTLQGDVFHLKSAADDAATSIDKNAEATDNAAIAAKSLSERLANLRTSFNELKEDDFGFLPFVAPGLPAIEQRLDNLTKKAAEFRKSMGLEPDLKKDPKQLAETLVKPTITRPIGGEFALVLPGKIDLPLNALERDIEKIEQKGITIAPTAIDPEQFRLKRLLEITTKEEKAAQKEIADFNRRTEQLKIKDDERTRKAKEQSADEEQQKEQALADFKVALSKQELETIIHWSKRTEELRIKDAKKTQKAKEKFLDLEMAAEKERATFFEKVSANRLKRQEKEAKEWLRNWEDATFEIQGAFENLFVNMFDDGKDAWEQFGEDIKRIMLRKFAEIMAAEIFGQIGQGLAQASGGGGGGDGGVFGSLLGPLIGTAATALLTPVLGPLAPVAGAVIGGAASKQISGGGGGSTVPAKTTTSAPFAEQFKFAEGGVVRKPTRALVGETGPEAVIPLQDGKIPVDIRQSDTINNMVSRMNTGMERIIEKLTTNNSSETERSSIIQIPGFQHGGVVTHPTVAHIGESGLEAVIPLASGKVPVDIRNSDNTSMINEMNASMERIVNTLITNDTFERDRTSDIKISGFQHGGVVRSSTLAQIGEAGPEAIIPLESGKVPVEIRESSDTTNMISQMNTSIEKIISTIITPTMFEQGRISDQRGGNIIEQIANSIQIQPQIEAPKIQLRGFATGGIVNTPTAAMIGERSAEAVVPLRGGNIPVEVRGGAGVRSIVIENMPISFPNADINNLDETQIEKNMTVMIPWIQRAIDNGEISIK